MGSATASTDIALYSSCMQLIHNAMVVPTHNSTNAVKADKDSGSAPDILVLADSLDNK